VFGESEAGIVALDLVWNLDEFLDKHLQEKKINKR